ncbi:MAG: UbiD family decarboxylase [Candidatus Tectomicrobia bacterium]|nr:UbiD family decarboxylase [Candidatus Tectomicrobia bacterium]
MHDLRSFLDELARQDDLLRLTQEINLNYAAAVFSATSKAVLFEHPAGYDAALAGSVCATRSKIGLALNVPERELLPTLRQRLETLPEPVLLRDGPVKAQRYVGAEVDLTALPIHLQHEKDGGPYISASMDITKNEAGGHNLGLRRLMVVDERHTTIDLRAPSDLRNAYRRALARGETLDIAFAIGMHPAYSLACLLKTPARDAYRLLAGLSPDRLELVPCDTVDLLVPAQAEYVLEGTLSPAGYTEVEGPFGEFLGSYGRAGLNPLVEIKAITHREQPIFQTMTISGRNLATTETGQLGSLRSEHLLWEILQRAIDQPVNVYCPPSTSSLGAVAAIKPTNSGDGKNALLALLATNVKFAVVVDDDVDIFNPAEVHWAITTRSQPDRDLIVVQDGRSIPLDPSLPAAQPPFFTAKLGIDATKSASLPPARFETPEPPFHELLREGLEVFLAAAGREEPERIAPETLRAEMLRLLDAGPCTYFDLLKPFARVPHQQLLRTVADLTSGGRLKRTADGRLSRR